MPDGASSNGERTIHRKAAEFVVRNGELLYRKCKKMKDGEKAKDFSPSKVDRTAAQCQQLSEAAKANIIVAQQKQKEQYDRKHCKPGTVNAR
jgi:hypothetical protein